MKSTDNFFKQNRAASSVIKVGERLFLSAYEKKAKVYARQTGQDLEVIERPQKKKAEPEPKVMEDKVEEQKPSKSNSKSNSDEK